MAPQTQSRRKNILSTETKDVQYEATISTENRDEKLKVTQQNNGTRKRNRNKVIESRKQQHEAINSIENEKFEDAEQNKENRKRKLNKVVSRTKAKEKPLSNANMSGGKMCPKIILEELSAEDLEKHGVMISKVSQSPITTTHNRQNDVISNNQSEATISTENLDEKSKEKQPNIGTRKRKRNEVVNTKNDIQKRNKIVSPQNKKKATKVQLFDRIRNETPMRDYLVNEIVLATVPGYVPWPARLLSINAQTISVQFFGTGHINLLRSNGICHFEVDKIVPLLGRKGYKKAVQELELALGVPKSASLV